MSARRVAADHQWLAEPCQLAGRRTHLPDDGLDAHLRAKIVARHRNVDAVGVQSPGAVAERGAIERLPIATMDEDDDRPCSVGRKDIDGVAPTRTIRHPARSAQLA